MAHWWVPGGLWWSPTQAKWKVKGVGSRGSSLLAVISALILKASPDCACAHSAPPESVRSAVVLLWLLSYKNGSLQTFCVQRKVSLAWPCDTSSRSLATAVLLPVRDVVSHWQWFSLNNLSVSYSIILCALNLHHGAKLKSTISSAQPSFRNLSRSLTAQIIRSNFLFSFCAKLFQTALIHKRPTSCSSSDHHRPKITTDTQKLCRDHKSMRVTSSKNSNKLAKSFFISMIICSSSTSWLKQISLFLWSVLKEECDEAHQTPTK